VSGLKEIERRLKHISERTYHLSGGTEMGPGLGKAIILTIAGNFEGEMKSNDEDPDREMCPTAKATGAHPDP
jgi:hypothetical protein